VNRSAAAAAAALALAAALTAALAEAAVDWSGRRGSRRPTDWSVT